MKKLVLTVVMICVAVVSHAAVANWKFSAANIYDGTGASLTANKLASGTALYVFDIATITVADVYKQWSAGKDVTTKAAVSTTLSGAGTLSRAGVAYADQGSGEHSFFFVIIDGKDKIYLSNTIAANAGESSSDVPVLFGSQKNSTTTFSASLPTKGGVQGYWNTSSVPEPTSGLLVMLGVGLMALRRRRA